MNWLVIKWIRISKYIENVKLGWCIRSFGVIKSERIMSVPEFSQARGNLSKITELSVVHMPLTPVVGMQRRGDNDFETTLS